MGSIASGPIAGVILLSPHGVLVSTFSCPLFFLAVLGEEQPGGDIGDDTDPETDDSKYNPDDPDNIRIDIEIASDAATDTGNNPILSGSCDSLFYHTTI